MYSSGERFMRSREGYFVVYFPGCAIRTTIFTHRHRVSNSVYILLLTSQSIADISLDIDYIHGGIHGRSYKKILSFAFSIPRIT